LDFGISKFNKLNSDSGMSMTRTGAVMGTPYYMSPEQAKGSKSMDHRSDLYSAGVILYEAITGQVPFNAETFNELIFKIVLETPAPPQTHVPNLDPSFASIMQKAMAREQNDRFQSAQEFSDALQAWLGSGQGVAHVPLGTTPSGLRPAPAPVASLGQTPPPWANTPGAAPGQTNTGAPAPKKGNPGVGIALAAVVVLGGGGALAFKLMSKSTPPEAPSVLAPAAVNTPAAAATPAPTPAETAKTEPAKAPDPTPTEAASASAKKPLPAAPAVPAKHLEKPGAAAPPPPAVPSPAAPPAATPAAAPTATGRKIRTEL
jgi:serine/threonine-protein kinase